MNWPALAAARRRDATTRVPFSIGGVTVGSVARAHLNALLRWPQWLAVSEHHVELVAADCDAALGQVNLALRESGSIMAWRDEAVAVFDPLTRRRLARIERAAARFWGTLTLGAHANGYVADTAGRPTHLWIGQRSTSKATDPGKFDNLVGGGVADGQTPLQALYREGWEEAGLKPDVMRQASAGRVLELQRDIAEGLQHEWLHVYDLRLRTTLIPANQDGEVAGFVCLPLADALQLAAGDAMTVDAALVTLDFALRHELLPTQAARSLHVAMQALTIEARTP